VESIPVELHNGSTTIATKRGSVMLNPKLRLNYVLYVSRLNCSLIYSATNWWEFLQCNIYEKPLCDTWPYHKKPNWSECTMKRGIQLEETFPNKHTSQQGGFIWYMELQIRASFNSNVSKFSSIISNRNKGVLCDVCFCAKQTRITFPISENKASNYFDWIHCDIWGTYRVKSFSSAQYFLTTVDDSCWDVWVYLTNEKSEASQLLMKFCAMVDTQFGTKV